MDSALPRHGRWRLITAAILLVTIPSRHARGQARNASRTPADGILNPYHAETAWHLWTQADGPVTVTIGRETHTVVPRPRNERKFPVLPEGEPVTGMPRLATVEDGKSTSAGFWDDCYMSLDNGHSNLRGVDGQFIVAPKVPAASGKARVDLRFSLGVNLTSQSYACRGRHIVDDPENNRETERDFYFANCIRATPAHASYKDNDPEKVHDDYDGLFSHSYQSVGQSSSEIRALQKMVVAGGCLSRDVKDLLKRHGVYPSALLALFRAALPYVDANGEQLPYEHELRHRPTYSSSGDVEHPHWCSANVHYHAYDENRHLANMIELARHLRVAPPVAILKHLSLRVEKGGKPVSAPEAERVHCATFTQARIWGETGETLTAEIDLGESYDLQGRELAFVCQALYPNQKNVAVKDGGSGRFSVTVRHDPNLPKGRIPVICVVRSGCGLPSNPVFVNFYWPDENEDPDFLHYNLPPKLREQRDKQRVAAGKPVLKRYPVTMNRRPVVDLGIKGDAVRCLPGEAVVLPIEVTDPEGFPVAVYRWPGEPGRLANGSFRYDVPADAVPGVRVAHLVFSDGTGGYTGRRVKLLVSPRKDSIPPGWQVTTLGAPAQLSVVTLDDGGRLTFSQAARPNDKRRLDATFLYRELNGDVSYVLELPEEPEDAPDLGLMLRGGVDDHWRFVSLGFSQGTLKTTLKKGESKWGTTTGTPDAELGIKPRFLRLSWRGGNVTLYASADANAWEMIEDAKLGVQGVVAGVYYAGGAQVQGRLRPAPEALPRLSLVGGKRGKPTLPFELAMNAGQPDAVLRYTVDGAEPTVASPVYEGPVTLETAGRHEIRMRAFTGGDGRGGATVVAVLDLEEKEE